MLARFLPLLLLLLTAACRPAGPTVGAGLRPAPTIAPAVAPVTAPTAVALTAPTTSPTPAATPWFAPYVDVTLPPTLRFDEAAEGGPSIVVLSFIVADPADPCRPSWGGQYSLDAAGDGLDLDGRIARLRARGGDVLIAFGGAAGTELATACPDEDALVAAYQAVIDRYAAPRLDLDVEGPALADRPANARRAAALRRLQAQNPSLELWLTLPVAPQGLTTEGLALLDDTLAAGVSLGGLNLMLMNYAGSRSPAMPIHDANIAALAAAAGQLAGAYRRAGRPLTEAEVWARLGATPMIGQNDVATDLLTTADAAALVAHARAQGLGRLSFWSLNRDRPCGAGIDVARANALCSGVEQEVLGFSRIFGGVSRLITRMMGWRANRQPSWFRAGLSNAPLADLTGLPRPDRSQKTCQVKPVWATISPDATRFGRHIKLSKACATF